MNEEDKEYLQGIADTIIDTLFDTDLTQEGMEVVLEVVKQSIQFAFLMEKEE
jgi:hypothetical protein